MTSINSNLHPLKTTRLKIAFAMVMFLWLIYTILQTLLTLEIISEDIFSIISFLPGIAAVVALLTHGFKLKDCFLTFAQPSKKGLILLSAVCIFALAMILPFGIWRGWNWKAAVIYAPASGISQELFFRSALLPILIKLLGERFKVALFTHSIFFALWHIGPLFLGAPIWAVVAIMVVPFISGLGWGWIVKHDQTVIWNMVQHSLIWVIAGQFSYGTF